jgi:hypothetical protein
MNMNRSLKKIMNKVTLSFLIGILIFIFGSCYDKNENSTRPNFNIYFDALLKRDSLLGEDGVVEIQYSYGYDIKNKQSAMYRAYDSLKDEYYPIVIIIIIKDTRGGTNTNLYPIDEFFNDDNGVNVKRIEKDDYYYRVECEYTNTYYTTITFPKSSKNFSFSIGIGYLHDENSAFFDWDTGYVVSIGTKQYFRWDDKPRNFSKYRVM